MSWIAPITWTFKQIPTFTNLNTEIRDKFLFFKTLVDDSGNLAPPARTTLTLASDACTPTQNAHAVDTEAAGATDNLSTLTIAGNIRSGHVLILSAANVAHVVTVKDGVGNISLLGGDCVLGTTKAFLLLQLVGTTWFELTRSLVAPVSAIQRLAGGNGSSVSAVAVDLATVAISGLTATDRLRIVVALAPVGGTMTAGAILRSVTDSLQLGGLNNGNSLATGGHSFDEYTVIVAPDDTKKLRMTGLSETNGSGIVNAWSATLTTDWTGAWTLALRSAGISAGTLYWSWNVYKMPG